MIVIKNNIDAETFVYYRNISLGRGASSALHAPCHTPFFLFSEQNDILLRSDLKSHLTHEQW